MLKIRIAAPAVEGAANEALIAFIARKLKLRKSDVLIRSGSQGRRKLLLIPAMDLKEVVVNLVR